MYQLSTGFGRQNKSAVTTGFNVVVKPFLNISVAELSMIHPTESTVFVPINFSYGIIT